MKDNKLTWTAHIDGVAEVGLNPGVTVKDAILRLAEYEHGRRDNNDSSTCNSHA